MNIWHDMSSEKVRENDFMAVVEITKGSKNKYELDKETGLLRLDRILYTATHYPCNYGFIPRTYAEDNDPLDVMLICSEPISPMTLVRSYPIGLIQMLDDGLKDEKIIAVPFGDPMYNGYHSIFDLPKHLYDEMTHFFRVYKTLEHKETVVHEVGGPEEALAVVAAAIRRYREKFGR